VWRTEDIAPTKVNRIAARDAITAAWKRIKAREEALKYANTMAEKIRASTAANFISLDPTLNHLEHELRLQVDLSDGKTLQRARRFSIDGVAPLGLRAGAFGSMQLSAFNMTESDDIPYPTLEMARSLIDNREKGFKTVMVLADAPKDMYYVVILKDRIPKRPDEFIQDVYSAQGPMREILDLYRAETMKRARESVLELLKQEFKYEETEEQKKLLDDSTKSGGRSDD
jgi:hypothetical protein